VSARGAGAHEVDCGSVSYLWSKEERGELRFLNDFFAVLLLSQLLSHEHQ
jgi:hypothetical protein